ncbi:MAG: S4 domain-containing protein [Alphaproteobacteria bacterium]
MEEFKQRLDQWLVHARFVKSRNLAKAIIIKGKMRINGERTKNISIKIKEGDILNFFKDDTLYMVKINSLSLHRVSAKDVGILYENLLENP